MVKKITSALNIEEKAKYRASKCGVAWAGTVGTGGEEGEFLKNACGCFRRVRLWARRGGGACCVQVKTTAAASALSCDLGCLIAACCLRLQHHYFSGGRTIATWKDLAPVLRSTTVCGACVFSNGWPLFLCYSERVGARRARCWALACTTSWPPFLPPLLHCVCSNALLHIPQTCLLVPCVC